jgi:hypothetical protein
VSDGHQRRPLDERVLGLAGVAVIAAVVAIYFVSQAVSAARGGAWFIAVLCAVLAFACAQAALRTWRRRG